MKSYIAVAQGTFIVWLIYRFSFFFTLIGNLLYITLIYHLWKNIYSNTETINGMTFNQAFIYVALGGALFVLLKTYTDWNISNRIINGSLIIDLVMPLDFQILTLARTAGNSLFNFIMITFPSVMVVFLVFQAEMKIGIGLIFLPIAIFMAFLISFTLDFSVGVTSFYTESLWGISMTKDVITSILSGALIPLQFFPLSVQRFLNYLPFQAIYNIPLTIVISPDLNISFYLRLLAIQVFWVTVLLGLSRWFFSKAYQSFKISGG